MGQALSRGPQIRGPGLLTPVCDCKASSPPTGRWRGDGSSLGPEKVWPLILVLQTRTVSRRCFLFFSLYFLICRTCIKTFWLFLPLKVVEDQNHPIFAKWGSIHKPKSAWSITSFIYLGNRNQFRHQNLYCFSVSCVACFPKRRYVICWDAVYILRGR